MSLNGVNGTNTGSQQQIDKQREASEQTPDSKQLEQTPNPPKKESVADPKLATQAPGQKTADPKSADPKADIVMPAPQSSNPKADAAWGQMGATAQSSSGPKAIPGSENVIDTPEEEKAQDLKRQVAEIGIRDALAKNGAPKDQLDKLTKNVLDKMFVGKGMTPGGNVGFSLAKDGGILHKDANGKEYYEFGIGGEGSSIDLNGDGKNDGARQYFRVSKSALDSGSTVPVTESPSDVKSTIDKPVPSQQDLAKPVKAKLASTEIPVENETIPRFIESLSSKLPGRKGFEGIQEDLKQNVSELSALKDGERFRTQTFDYYKIGNEYYATHDRSGVATKLSDNSTSIIVPKGDNQFEAMSLKQLGDKRVEGPQGRTYGYNLGQGKIITHAPGGNYRFAQAGADGSYSLTALSSKDNQTFKFDQNGILKLFRANLQLSKK